MAVQGHDALQVKPIFDHKDKVTVIFGQTWPSQLFHIRTENSNHGDGNVRNKIRLGQGQVGYIW